MKIRRRRKSFFVVVVCSHTIACSLGSSSKHTECITVILLSCGKTYVFSLSRFGKVHAGGSAAFCGTAV